ncbi:MAG TPA: thiosulfate sulfurtransferase GlpE [Psychromonas sp.]
MPGYQLISAYQAKQRALKENVQLVDIRDRASFASEHPEGAFHLTNETVGEFMKKVDINTPVFVICYHGNSSKGAAQYLCERGYLDVYSVDGGFADWRLVNPHG